MIRRLALFLGLAFALAACATPNPGGLGSDGQTDSKIYRIDDADTSEIRFRFLDAVNTLRAASGLSQVMLSEELTAAALSHARDMSVQNRSWWFGSDGSTPFDRAARAGFNGRVLGENNSESFESELETLTAWMTDPITRGILLDASATDLGIAWFQEPAGKIWWTAILGERAAPLLQG